MAHGAPAKAVSRSYAAQVAQTYLFGHGEHAFHTDRCPIVVRIAIHMFQYLRNKFGIMKRTRPHRSRYLNAGQTSGRRSFERKLTWRIELHSGQWSATVGPA